MCLLDVLFWVWSNTPGCQNHSPVLGYSREEEVRSYMTLFLGRGLCDVIDMSILPSKHSIVGPLSSFGLLNSFVVAFVTAFSIERQ